MARQVRAEKTRATIITAAADLFDRQGYEATSLSDIVEHARVTKGRCTSTSPPRKTSPTPSWNSSPRPATGSPATPAPAAAPPGGADAPHLLRGPPVRRGPRAAGRTAARHRHHPAAPSAQPPFTEWLDIVSARLAAAVEESDVHPDADIDVVAHSLVCFFVGTQVVGRAREPAARGPRRTAEMWQLLIRGLVPVTRRARYLSSPPGWNASRPAVRSGALWRPLRRDARRPAVRRVTVSPMPDTPPPP